MLSSSSKIALVGPNFFSYIEGIRQKMVEFGLDVEFFDERHKNNPIAKAFYRLGIYGLLDRTRRHLDNIAHRIISGGFKNVLLIDVEVVDRRFVKCLVDAGLHVHIYMWDSVKNKSGYLKFLDLLSGKASFDPGDCDRFGLKYIPLFAEDVFIEKGTSSDITARVSMIDICFCGTLHSNRAKIISELECWGRQKNLKISLLLYFHAKWMFTLKCIFMPSNFRFINRISSMGFSKFEIANLFNRSIFVLDIHHPGQAGLTARTFEVLRSGSRLITFNEKVQLSIPKSLESRIFFINNFSDLDQINFYNIEPLRPLSVEEDYYLSVNRFVEDMLELMGIPAKN